MSGSAFLLVTAPAKINLYLGVHPEKDGRGYHRVDSVMTAIDLTDTLAIAPAEHLMVRTVPEADFPMEENTAYRAAVAMGEAFDREPAFAILIDKHIPVKSGLGGASSDAAAVIMGICRYWGVDPTDPRIDRVARSVGADVPFFLYGPPAYFSGAGDVMDEIFRPLTGTPVALVKPLSDGVSTREAYERFDAAPPAAGSQPAMPWACASSIAGMSSDHILAAIMTPAGKPSRTRCREREVRLRDKKTIAAPRAVIRAVKPVPPAAQRSACVTVYVPFF
mgnify:CR=1 FL=1